MSNVRERRHRKTLELKNRVQAFILSHPKIANDEELLISELVNDVNAETGLEKHMIYQIIEDLTRDGKLFRPKLLRIKKT